MATPHGRDAVRTALIETATRLFAQKGPAAVGVREIAKQAGVNHGLIHRHFGSKDGLLKAVMQHLSESTMTDMGAPKENERLQDLFTALLNRSDAAQDHWRILARAMLDGQAPASLQQRFPVYERLIAAIRRRNPQRMTPEAVTTLVMATGLGILVFGPWIRAATGQDGESWSKTMAQILQRLSDELPKD